MDITVWIFTIQLVCLLKYFKWIFLDLDFDLVFKMAPARTSGAFFGKPKGGRGSWTPANGPYLGQAWFLRFKNTHATKAALWKDIIHHRHRSQYNIWRIKTWKFPCFCGENHPNPNFWIHQAVPTCPNPRPRPRQLPKLPGWWVKVLKLRTTLGSGRGYDFVGSCGLMPCFTWFRVGSHNLLILFLEGNSRFFSSQFPLWSSVALWHRTMAIFKARLNTSLCWCQSCFCLFYNS